jgi:hypothetical protein
VIDAAASAFSLTPERNEQVTSLLTAIQANDPQSQSHLHALITGARPRAPTVQVHPAPAALAWWATNHGYSKPDSYKGACETGGSLGTRTSSWTKTPGWS